MNAAASFRRYARAGRQRGAVAIVFGFSIFVLFGFLALVVDLGRTYVVRTELQNAADAAALAGAKQLNQTLAGVTSAVNYAIAMAAQNNHKFSLPVTITAANLSVGACPEDPCMVPASSISSDADAGGRTFLKVDISGVQVNSFFATAANFGSSFTTTFGLAVAGRFVNDITPIGVCAIKDATGASRPKGEVLAGTNELAQFGFRRGVSYNVFTLGPLGTPSNPYLLDPVDAYPSPCNPANASANVTAPFICNGSSAILTTSTGTVYGNTGLTAGKIEAALNSRFNQYGGASVCIPALAPPDINTKNYACTGAGCASPAIDWMSPTPTVETISSPGAPVDAKPASADQYGVLWSYSRAVRAVGATPNATPGTAFTTVDWGTLYPPLAGAAPAANANFPATGSPYLDSGNAAHYQFQSTGQPNRRVLNLAIVNCPGVTGSGSCQVIPVLGIGRFFMQVPADFSGSPQKLEVEFAGLIEPIPTSDIKLYR